jgi:hypothetical protein
MFSLPISPFKHPFNDDNFEIKINLSDEKKKENDKILDNRDTV